MAKITRALLSVTDKTGIVEFARGLAETGVEILSTGGTAKAIRDGGVEVKDVSEHTGFPEMLDGRVKTLHPKVHGGLLGRRDLESHQQQMAEHGIGPIDLVAVNLYAFEKTVADPEVKVEDAVENIDIGGPSMLRSAAKNHASVTVVVDPADYEGILAEIKEKGEVSLETNRRCAVKAFATTAAYDSAIERFFHARYLDNEVIHLRYEQGRAMRYGENSHQAATFYLDPASQQCSIARAEVLHGKALSFNNIVDADAALQAAQDIADSFGAVVIKHTNPCGMATGETMKQALEMAWEGDVVSAFGSVIACTRTVDLPAAQVLKGRFVEILIAPDYTDDALEFLRAKSKDLRILKVGDLKAGPADQLMYKSVVGGMLAQGRDLELMEKWEVASRTAFDDALKPAAEFTWIACKHTKSNAIVLGYEYAPGQCMVVGMGAGQPNRVDSLRKLSATKARENFERLWEAAGKPGDLEQYVTDCMAKTVLASDAFFPFADTVEAAAGLGVKTILQPGGSKRDDEVIAEADRHGIALVMTGMRHFRH